MKFSFTTSALSESFAYEVPAITALYNKLLEEAIIREDLNEIRVGEAVATRNAPPPKGWLGSKFASARDEPYHIATPGGLKLDISFKGNTPQQTIAFIVGILALDEAKRLVPEADKKAALKAALLDRAARL